MELKSPKSVWVESLFDVSQPYLYLVVLPALILFALGFRRQAIVFSLGAAVFLTLVGAS